jgi:hypothetical protein
MHVRAMMMLMNARLASELAWSETFRAELASGKYRTKGDPDWAPPGVVTAKRTKHAGPAKTAKKSAAKKLAPKLPSPKAPAPRKPKRPAAR